MTRLQTFSKVEIRQNAVLSFLCDNQIVHSRAKASGSGRLGINPRVHGNH